MAQSYRSRYLAVQAANERAMRGLFKQLAESISAEVTRRADGDGVIDRPETLEILRLANEKITNFFLGYDRRGKRAPFEVLPNGQVFPLSPFMRQLWAAISAAVQIPVEQNANELIRRLPPDILVAMRQAKVDPFAAGRAQVSEQIFRPNPLAEYDPPHTWVDPNGYTLSDRVWNTTTHTRQQIDLYLDTAIREGRGALAMSRELAQFLTPGEQVRNTNKPYNTTASFSAMRLARTEITHAAGMAAEVSAAMNPFVAGMKWNLSASHPKIDICDAYARGGPNGDGVYPLGSTPPYPAHPHCLCFLTNALVGNPDEILDELREDIRRERALLVDKVGPVAVEKFTALLLGETPAGVIPPVVAPKPITQKPVVTPPPIVPPGPPVTPPPVRRGQEIPTAEDFEKARLAGEELRRQNEARRLALEEERRQQEARQAAQREALRLQLEREEREAAARAAQEAKAAEERAAQRRAERAANRGDEIARLGYDPNDPAQVRPRLIALAEEHEKRLAPLNQNFANAESQFYGVRALIQRQEKTVEKVTGTHTEERQRARLAKLIAERDKWEVALEAARVERNRAVEERNAQIRALVSVRDPSRTTINFYGHEPGAVAHWQKGIDAFNQLVSADVAPELAIEFRDRGTRGAHYNRVARTVNVAPDDDLHMIVHELGHWLDGHNPEVRRKTFAFFDRRTVGEQTGPIIGSGVGRRDKFIHYYMGREYYDDGERVSSEITSMGIEYLYNEPVTLAKQDADYFDFIFNLLRGQ